jgi:hypothetical protein
MKSSQRKAMFARIRSCTQLRTVRAPPFHSANHLPIQVSVIVPSTKDKSKPLSDTEFAQRVDSEKKWFDRRFGGDTAVKDVGSYLMNGKTLISEGGMIVEASTTSEKYNNVKKSFAKHVEARRKQWGQDTMASRVEGQLFIVPKKSYIDSEKKPERNIIVT